MAERGLQGMLGNTVEITGLTSERGRALNGRSGRVVGHSSGSAGADIRVHLRVPGEEAVLKLKLCNVAKLGTLAAPDDIIDGPNVPCAPVSTERRNRVLKVTRPMIGDDLARYEADARRPDWIHRAMRLTGSIDASLAGSSVALRCGEVGPLAERSDDELLKHVISLKPACVGDGYFRVEHIFATGGFGADDGQAGIRMKEFIASGLCVPCQMHYMEKSSCIWQGT